MIGLQYLKVYMSNMSNREALIIQTFKDYKEIFDEGQDYLLASPFKKAIQAGNKQIIYYIPYEVPIDEMGYKGFKLKCDVGYVAMQETIEKPSNRVLSYNYRFVSSEYDYLFACKKGNDDRDGLFNFHFDKCDSDVPHQPHVTVINPCIRYMSKSIELKEFLKFIRDIFYYQGPGGLTRKKGHIWNSQMAIS